MARKITQRELRNESGAVMRALDEGHSFVVTRNGVPVGELTPVAPRRFVAADALVAAFRTAPVIDVDRFLVEIDGIVDQDPTPRA